MKRMKRLGSIFLIDVRAHDMTGETRARLQREALWLLKRASILNLD
jgi:hypothetical protein